jgi:hypothetical protein
LQRVVNMATMTFPTETQNHHILFDATERRYYTLDSLAAMVWSLMQHPVTLREIRDALVERFGAEPEMVERDVLNVLREMESNGLIEAANS